MTAPIMLLSFAAFAGIVAPRLLAGSPWFGRSPRLGVLAWQALSCSVVVAVILIGAALALPEVPFRADLAEMLSACAAALRAQYATPGGAAVSATGAVLGVTVLARGGYCLVTSLLSAARERRRQSDALALVARGHDGSEALVVDHPAAAAYCLRGRRPQIVLTSGAVAALDDDELAAVLAHERAHLRGRHDLVLAVSGALHRAFPWVPVFRVAHRELTRLVEMVADDVAARRNDRLTVAAALVRLAEASAPAAALGAGGTTSLARVRRLVAPAHPLGTARSVLAAFAIAALVATPVAVVVAPAVVAASADLCPVDLSARTFS